MRFVLTSLLCAIIGAIAASLAFVGFNLVTYGNPIGAGHYVRFDLPILVVAGLLWGLLASGLAAVWRRRSAAGNIVLRSLFVTLAGVIVVGGGITAQRSLVQPRTPTINGKELWLDFELRLPGGSAGLPRGLRRGDLRTHGQGTDIVRAELELDQMVVQDGRMTIPGSAQLRRTARDRELNIFTGDVPWPSFTLALPGVPTKADMAWTAWQPADGGGNTRDHQRALGYQIRYRVTLDSD